MEHSLEKNKAAVGKIHKVLIEGTSKRSTEQYCGRNTQNVMCVFPKTEHGPGSYVNIKVTDCTSATLIGEVITE